MSPAGSHCKTWAPLLSQIVFFKATFSLKTEKAKICCLCWNLKKVSGRATGWTGLANSPSLLSTGVCCAGAQPGTCRSGKLRTKQRAQRRTRRMTVSSESVIYNEKTGLALVYAWDVLIIFFKYTKSCCKGVKCSSCPYRTRNNILRCSEEVPVRH